MDNVSVRLAKPEEAEMFAEWAIQNRDIPHADKYAVQRAKCPMTLVVEIGGKPELFMPLLPAVTIGFLGFRPDQHPETKVNALKAMKGALRELQVNLGIEDAYVFTRPEYSMGKWALKNGFKTKPNIGFSLER